MGAYRILTVYMGCITGAIVAHLMLIDKVKKYYPILKFSVWTYQTGLMDVSSGSERIIRMIIHSPFAKGSPSDSKGKNGLVREAPLSRCEGKNRESGTAYLRPPAGSLGKPGGGPDFPGKQAGKESAMGDHCTYSTCQYIH